MTYNRPEITVLGDATRVIKQSGKGSQFIDGLDTRDNAPAYDLDE
jgi:hypothetical protein